MKTEGGAFVWLALIALVAGVLRFFMKGWVKPLGVSDAAGSFIASVTLVLGAGLVVLFVREGLAAGGRYWRAAGWFALLALWIDCLIAAGILITAWSGIATYYEERTPLGEHVGMPPVRHAVIHLAATVPAAIVGAILGGVIYWLARLGRKAEST